MREGRKREGGLVGRGENVQSFTHQMLTVYLPGARPGATRVGEGTLVAGGREEGDKGETRLGGT